VNKIKPTNIGWNMSFCKVSKDGRKGEKVERGGVWRLGLRRKMKRGKKVRMRNKGYGRKDVGMWEIKGK
ncbi:hypothetical protein, partial [Neisseria sicca]|uniref:hypothetical protein n=1 Tax=Neisseria sicca TaxID=490 RepID=UPI001C9935F0